jgi:monomeric isocitrate dehydrogenase
MSLYITELAGLVKGRSRSEESKREYNKNQNDTSRNNNSVIEENKINKRADKTRKLTSTKQDFLEFLIQEETKFADLEKIEDFYDNSKIKNFTQFNKNQNLIINKKEELKKLEETIQMALLNSFKIKEQDLVTFYDEQIKELKDKIVLKEHDLECYSHTHQRLYKANVRNIF